MDLGNGNAPLKRVVFAPLDEVDPYLVPPEPAKVPEPEVAPEPEPVTVTQ